MPSTDDRSAISDRATMSLRSGAILTVRAVGDGDAHGLQAYIRNLSVPSRYSRMLGATSELPPAELQAILHPADADHVALIATLIIDGRERIVGEARLAHDIDIDTVELALSVDDRWRRSGLGEALFLDLQRRATTAGPIDLFGDTLRTNDAMLGLARKHGFALQDVPNDARLVRFSKHLDRRDSAAHSATASPAFIAL